MPTAALAAPTPSPTPASAIVWAVAWIGLAYLCGSIPFGVVVARLRGVDLRKVGSGNIGATNVARALGKPLGIFVFLCDAAKGYLPVACAGAGLSRVAPDAWAILDGEARAWLLAGAGAAAFLGHITTPWLRFQGGKGVATAFGVFVAVAPLAAAVALATFGITYALTRISSLGSLLSATVFVPALLLLGQPHSAQIALAAFMWAIIVLRHRDNLQRLLQREEGRV